MRRPLKGAGAVKWSGAFVTWLVHSSLTLFICEFDASCIASVPNESVNWCVGTSIQRCTTGTVALVAFVVFLLHDWKIKAETPPDNEETIKEHKTRTPPVLQLQRVYHQHQEPLFVKSPKIRSTFYQNFSCGKLRIWSTYNHHRSYLRPIIQPKTDQKLGFPKLSSSTQRPANRPMMETKGPIKLFNLGTIAFYNSRREDNINFGEGLSNFPANEPKLPKDFNRKRSI